MYDQLTDTSPNILGFRILEGLTKKQQKQIRRLLEERLDKSENIRLYLLLEPRKTADVESLLFDLSFVYIYSDKIERMAVVGTRAWHRTWIGLFGMFARIRTAYFDRSASGAAWKWI